MQFQRSVLKNNLRVITVPMPSFESVTVMVMVRAGSRFENKENNGISHFLEHMAFKGTKKRPNAMAISTLVDSIGGEFNAYTGKETTGYYVKSSKNNIDLCLDVLSDMLQNSLLSQKEINKERGVILEEINLYEDTPVRKISDIFEMLLYGNTPMGWDIAGDKNVIKKIQREDFLGYLNHLYSATNIAVVVAGGVTPNKVNKLARKYFGGMKKFKTIEYSKIKEAQKQPQILIKKKKTEQVHIALGFRTVPIAHPKRFIIEILSAILGGGMSSRLFSEIREKRGLAYYIRTNSEHYLDCGNLVSTAGVDVNRVEEAIRIMVDEYRKLANWKKPVTEKELKKAKKIIKGHLVLELEDSRSVAGFYAHQELLEEKLDNPDEIIAKIEKITLKEVKEAAKTYLVNKNLNLAAIGNFPDGQKFKKLLHL